VYYQKDLDITIKISGQHCLDVAVYYQNVGNVHHSQGNGEVATSPFPWVWCILMYTQAYHIFLKVLGPDHPHTQGLKRSSKISRI
jgi:hypothetical protein